MKNISVIDKQYGWPDLDMANGSGDCTRAAKLIASTLQTLGEVIHDFAKITEQRQDKHFGFYQLCPKCEGQGRILTPPGLPHGVTEWSSSATDWECDVCNGDKLLVRPEIKPGEQGYING